MRFSVRFLIKFSIFCLVVFGLNLAYEYKKFKDFSQNSYLNLEAVVLQNYEKTGKFGNKYFVLKLKTDEFSFYTTTKNKINAKSVITKVNPTKISFKDYLSKQFYMPNLFIKPVQNDSNFRLNLSSKIISFHQNPKIGELYSALYLATPISKELRANVTNWGIAHIIAISGFHLSLLFAMLFFMLKPLYKPLQKKFFPYRDLNFDISLFIFVLAIFYLWILDFTPSFFRSLIMGIVGFLLICRGIKVFAIENLFICIALALSFCPNLAFSLGFYFSCLGVFFIFLYIKYFGDTKSSLSPLKLFLHSLGLSVFVYCCMNLPVYYFFHSASLFQLGVIPLGYVFMVFYPISIIAHLLGCGDFFDVYLLNFLEFANEQAQIYIPTWLFVAFNLSLVLAVRFKFVGLLIAICGGGIYFFNLFF